jgi:hypothetical protein
VDGDSAAGRRQREDGDSAAGRARQEESVLDVENCCWATMAARSRAGEGERTARGRAGEGERTARVLLRSV